MATIIPPPSKKAKRQAQQPQQDILEVPKDLHNVRIKFQAFDTGDVMPGTIMVPGDASVQQLQELLNQLKQQTDEATPYEFALLSGSDSLDINNDLYTDILKPQIKSSEDILTIVYTPRAVFKVKSITRSSGAGMGHGATILAAQFSPSNSALVVTGAGDATARVWNAYTQTPTKTMSGHSDWVLAVSFSPCGSLVATAGMDQTIRIWDPKTGQEYGKPLRGHLKFITSLCWEPYHLAPIGSKPRLASSSKDGTVRVWAVDRGVCEFSMSGHKASVSCVKWGGFGDIYSTSHDKTIKVWSSSDGRLVANLTSHGHWVNHLALSTEFALRTGPFSEKKLGDLPEHELKALAKDKFNKLASVSGELKERIVTASDDFTMFLWEPRKGTKPLCRMTGHQKLVNHVAFSPDGRYISSASFDNSVKLWDGRDGKFIASLRGHVAPVYQCAWSADCRLLVSCSKDTTLKVWDIKTRKLKSDLPGHQDEVYAVDWSVDGERVVSGGKDKTVRFWTH